MTLFLSRPAAVRAFPSSLFVKKAAAASSARAASTSSSVASSLSLKNPSLLPPVDSSQPTFAVHNPAQPDSIVSHVTLMRGEHAREAIAQSNAILPSWRDGTTGAERGRLLSAWSRLIQENADDIATIMTLESGKPLAESHGEINYGRSFLDYYAAEAVRPTSAGGGSLIPTPFAHAATGAPRGQIMTLQQAVGVTAMITPWNFPIAMFTRKVGPALAAGCTALVKPSELTPLTALAVHSLAVAAGIPAEVVQVITAADRASSAEVGTEFCGNPLVSKVSFTGSVAVGKQLMRQCSDTVKRLSLELGGNAPFVVFDDATLDQAVEAALASKFRNAGQTCVCADRFLVQNAVYEEFCERLAQRAQALRVGPGMDPATQMGPLITSRAVEEVAAKVEEAMQQDGAVCLAGGQRRGDLGSHFYDPTVLCDVPTTARIWHTETFGPVAAIHRFATDQEALDLANDARVGLASYFCTRDLSRAFTMAQKLEAGLVGVNEGIISTAVAPFGGVKESGLGREGSSLGMAEYLETKYVFMNY